MHGPNVGIVINVREGPRPEGATNRFEQSYQSTLVAASGVQYVGYDIYTDDIYNTANGLGAQAAMIASAQSTGANCGGSSGVACETFASEIWLPSWAPASGTATDQAAYEGVGNCDWWTYGQIRQEMTAMALWGASAGLTEINMFSAASTSTTCVYEVPGNFDDKISSGY